MSNDGNVSPIDRRDRCRNMLVHILLILHKVWHPVSERGKSLCLGGQFDIEFSALMNFFSLGSTVQHRFNGSTVASCGSLTRYLQLRNVTGRNIFLFLRDESALKEAWLSVRHCSWGGWFFQDLRSLSSHGNGSIYICCFYYYVLRYY